jgi:hypothetical protein
MIVLAALLLFLGSPLFAETTIAQIDPSSLLTRQRVDIYVSVSDGTGGFLSGLGAEHFALFEGIIPDTLEEVDSFSLVEGVNASDGIIFQILVDNSGSMYDRLDGTTTSIPSQTRMAAVGRAVSSFLNAVDNPKDLIGMASFNTHYSPGILPQAVRSDVEAAYSEIRNRVLREYRLSYRPAMMGGDKRTVRVEFLGPGGPSTATQYYFTGTLFASDSSALGLLLLIPLLLAPVLLFALTRLKLLNKQPDANLEVLDGGLTRMFSLSDGRTVIGQAGGELTIIAAGAAPTSSEDVTIIKEAAGSNYTIVSSKPVYVNNRATTNRKLSPGDVIRIGEATIVFDEPAPPVARSSLAPKDTKST